MKANQTILWRVGNMKMVGWCTACFAVISLLLLIGGAILSGIKFTEVRPNYSDTNYDRYLYANVGRIVGPIMIALGGVMLLGSCAFAAFSYCSLNKYYQPGRIKYSVRASQENIPDVDEKGSLEEKASV